MIVVGLPVVRRTKVNVWKRLYQFRDCVVVRPINVNVRLVAKKNLQTRIRRLNQQIRMTNLKNALRYGILDKVRKQIKANVHWLVPQVGMKVATPTVGYGQLGAA